MAYTTINKSSDYFNTKLYTGDNSSNRGITGVGFQPDLVWNKNRSSSANHNLWNGVTGITERLTSSGTQASEDYSSEFLSFDSDGVTITQNAAILDINNSSYNYVNWNWLASNTTASNTDGSITSTVSANTTSGFSIVSYSGDGGSSSTVGHGLGAIPKMVIIKCRTSTPSWQVWGDGYTRLSLNNTDGDLGSNGMTRGASTVTLPSGINDWNGSGQDYIMYCWSEVKGFSKFGQYTGNGSTDGTFVYTGFKPAWFMTKKINASGENWNIQDNTRSAINPVTNELVANISDAEYTAGSRGDFLSNGFKLRTTSGGYNNSGSTYIYMAFAESPLVGTNNIPATAR
jgi:hypothetical protein